MSLVDDLEKIISQEWKNFVRVGTAECGAREIHRGVDYDLITNLKSSFTFAHRATDVPKMTKRRELEWAEARRLELTLEKKYKRISHSSGTSLLSSISHTHSEELGIVAGITCLTAINEPNSVQNIGIDIEFSKRKLPTELIQRFFIPDELEKFSLTPLENWVLREAAFKATPRDLQLVVTQYQLLSWSEKTLEGVMVSKNAKCNVKLVNHSDINIGLSYFKY